MTAPALSGTFFLSELDPTIALKSSRDPLGFQVIWSSFGRELVGNLTTVTRSTGKRPVEGSAVHVEKVGHMVAGLAVAVDQFPGV